MFKIRINPKVKEQSQNDHRRYSENTHWNVNVYVKMLSTAPGWTGPVVSARASVACWFVLTSSSRGGKPEGYADCKRDHSC